MVRLSATTPLAAPLCGCRGRTASCWCAASRLAQRPESQMPMKALVPLKIDFFRWRSRNNERSATRPITSEANGELPMHFRIYDLAADRCVWSIPPIDTVPVKLGGQKLVVRAIDNDGGVFEVASVD